MNKQDSCLWKLRMPLCKQKTHKRGGAAPEIVEAELWGAIVFGLPCMPSSTTFLAEEVARVLNIGSCVGAGCTSINNSSASRGCVNWCRHPVRRAMAPMVRIRC
jgi:hypothetical protein